MTHDERNVLLAEALARLNAALDAAQVGTFGDTTDAHVGRAICAIALARDAGLDVRPAPCLSGRTDPLVRRSLRAAKAALRFVFR